VRAPKNFEPHSGLERKGDEMTVQPTKARQRPPKARRAFDPRVILEEIAADESAPKTARVAAAKALLTASGPKPELPADDPVSTLARQILARKNQ
jgi:hypothetical protein